MKTKLRVHPWGIPPSRVQASSQARSKLKTKPDTGLITEVNPPKPNS